MEQSFAVDQNVEIGIELEKETYTSGEQVNGIIFTSFLENPQNTQLVLKVKGKEDVNFWRNVRNESNTDDKTIKISTDVQGLQYKETNFKKHYHFLNHQFQLKQWDDNEEVNKQNKLPFSFTQPAGIPSSFKLDWNHLHKGNSCKIFYYVKVYQIPIGSHILSKPIMSKKLYFEILENEDAVDQKRNFKINQKLDKCFCIFQGFSNISVKLDKPYYYPDEVAQVHLVIDNSFNLLDISRIRVFLLHNQEVRTDNHSWSFTNNGASQVTQGLKSRERRSEADPIIQKMPLTKIFGTFRNSTYGRTITNRYQINIEVFMDGKCVSPKSRILKGSLDQRIVDESGHNLEKMNGELPGSFDEYMMYQSQCNWNPVIHDGMVCMLLDEYKIQKAGQGTIMTEKNQTCNSPRNYMSNNTNPFNQEEKFEDNEAYDGNEAENVKIAQTEMSQTFLGNSNVDDNKGYISKKIYEKKRTRGAYTDIQTVTESNEGSMRVITDRSITKNEKIAPGSPGEIEQTMNNKYRSRDKEEYNVIIKRSATDDS